MAQRVIKTEFVVYANKFTFFKKRGFFALLFLFCSWQGFGQSILAGKLENCGQCQVIVQAYMGFNLLTMGSTTANPDGEFQMNLPKLPYEGLYQLNIQGQRGRGEINLVLTGQNLNVIAKFEDGALLHDNLTFSDALNTAFTKLGREANAMQDKLDILREAQDQFAERPLAKHIAEEKKQVQSDLGKTYDRFLERKDAAPIRESVEFRKQTDVYLNPVPAQFDAEFLKAADLSSKKLVHDPQVFRYYGFLFQTFEKQADNPGRTAQDFLVALHAHTEKNPALQRELMSFFAAGFEQMENWTAVDYVNKLMLFTPTEEGHWLPGSKMPPWRALDNHSREVRSVKFKNQDYLLVFWSPECPACVEALDKWEELKNRHSIKLVGIAIDSKPQDLEKFDDLPFAENLFEDYNRPDNPSALFKITGTPTIVWVEKSGRIKGRYSSVASLVEALAGGR